MKRFNEQEFIELLKEGGFVDAEVVDRLQEVSQKEERSIAELIMEQGVLTNEQMGQLMSMQTGLNYSDLKHTVVDEALIRRIPSAFAVAHQMVPFKEDEEGIHVATSRPYDDQGLDLLEKKLGGKLVIHYATPGDMKGVFGHYKDDYPQRIQAIAESIKGASEGEKNGEDMVQLLDLLVQYAYSMKASDLHVEPQQADMVIRFRVDGVLTDVMSLDKDILDSILMRVKILSRLRTDEHFAAQDGHIRFEYDGEMVDVRISIIPTVDGEKIVMRLLAGKDQQFSLEELGMSHKDLAMIKDQAHKPFGMILVTGPTGAGKSTTLYSVLKLLNRREVNISTIEDPVEYSVEGINQIQVNNKTNLTFSEGLKSLVRQDPDIIMVGEIRDSETADISVNAALTGHLLLSTLHTNDAATALPRLMEMDVEPYLVASTVNIVVGQRLVRKVCKSCISSEQVHLHELEEEGVLVPEEAKARLFKDGVATLYRGKGCALCHGSGYHGRVGVFEILEVDDAIRKLIVEQASANVIEDAARGSQGMTVMFDDALDKVAQGVTTLEEILRVIPE